jgi:hypothetical protein
MDGDACASEDQVFAQSLDLRIPSFCGVDKDEDEGDDDLDEMDLLVVTAREEIVNRDESIGVLAVLNRVSYHC